MGSTHSIRIHPGDRLWEHPQFKADKSKLTRSLPGKGGKGAEPWQPVIMRATGKAFS